MLKQISKSSSALFNANKTMSRCLGVGTAMRISQDVTISCHRLVATEPAVVLIESGTKIISDACGRESAVAGQVVIVDAASEADIINEVGADGTYRAIAISFDLALLPQFALNDTKPTRRLHMLSEVPEAFCTSIVGAAAAIADSNLPTDIVRHRVEEVLLWVREMGISITRPPSQSLVSELRSMISADPSAKWNTDRIADSVSMSEATLRRKLAKAGTTLTDLITDVRMTSALALLQSTENSITEISFAVGYESPSRFSLRFRNRFGFAPSELRRNVLV